MRNSSKTTTGHAKSTAYAAALGIAQAATGSVRAIGIAARIETVAKAGHREPGFLFRRDPGQGAAGDPRAPGRKAGQSLLHGKLRRMVPAYRQDETIRDACQCAGIGNRQDRRGVQNDKIVPGLEGFDYASEGWGTEEIRVFDPGAR